MATETQPTPPLDNKRRSSRVFARVRVAASGKSAQGRTFRESSETILVNAHGCLLYLNAELAEGGIVTVTNPASEEEQECRVVFLGDSSKKGQRVGLEFLTPAPHFWGIDFAPDWSGPPPAIH
jgi:hypothetical protein